MLSKQEEYPVGTSIYVVYAGHHHKDTIGRHGILEAWEIDEEQPGGGLEAKFVLDDGQIIWSNEAHCVVENGVFDLVAERQKIQEYYKNRSAAGENLYRAIEAIEQTMEPNAEDVEKWLGKEGEGQ